MLRANNDNNSIQKKRKIQLLFAENVSIALQYTERPHILPDNLLIYYYRQSRKQSGRAHLLHGATKKMLSAWNKISALLEKIVRTP